MKKYKLIRTSTVPTSLTSFLNGVFEVLMTNYELLRNYSFYSPGMVKKTIIARNSKKEAEGICS